MTIKNWVNYSLIIIVISIILINKISVIDNPFFWDEAWVYAEAVKQMAFSPSLFTGSIEESLSRGHPLLFHFSGGIWVRIFGNSIISMHLFPLISSLVLLILILKKASNNRRINIATVSFISILFFNKVVWAQLVFVLPEIFLMGLLILSALSYFKQQIAQSIIYLSLALLVKETAIILLITYLTSELFIYLNTKNKIHISNSIKFLLSLIPILLFFIHQYLSYNYVFFPEHIDYIVLKPNEIQHKLLFIYNYIFFAQDRNILTFIILTIILTSSIGKHKISLFFFIFIFHKIITKKVTINPVVDLTLLIVTFLIICWISIKTMPHQISRGFIVSIIFIFGFMLFSSMNFLSNRYLISAIGFVCIIPILFHETNSQIGRIFRNISALFVLSFFITHSNIPSSTGDDSMGYLDTIKTHKLAINFIEQKANENEEVYCSFILAYYINNESSGYRNTNKKLKTTNHFADETKFVIESYLGENIFTSLDSIHTHGYQTCFIEGKSKICILEKVNEQQ